MRFVAFTIKGIEGIVEQELREQVGAIEIAHRSDKVILFDYEGSLEPLTKLRTVDDIGIYICTLEPSKKLDLSLVSQVVKSLTSFRHIDTTFSVTTSIVSVEIDKEEYAHLITEELGNSGLILTSDNRTNLDFRIFLNREIGFLSIRLTQEPLNKREYEVGNYLGALKPTIASAMVQLAKYDLPKDARLVDNFCGSGTILCEAQLHGFQVYGGDINPKAVTLTKQRLKLVKHTVSENIKLQDATKTKWNIGYFDCGISNLPWDKQHAINHVTDLYAKTIKEYSRILKPTSTLCIICHKPDLLSKLIKKEFGVTTVKQIDIGYLGQTPSILIAHRHH
jgi:23S rRNA G2445 N2-methylase RlmL